ncbi:MAG: hypothetical protein JWL63_859 [Rhodocyclales bacterium]|nr:hypothetical protein [Rhodocyclales bacterium]
MNPNSILIKAVVSGYLAAAALDATAASAEKAERDKIKAEYNMDMEKCGSLSGNPRDVCKVEAKAHEAKAEAKLKADKDPSAKASRRMQEEYAEIDYKVAREKCDALKGNDKDVCVKEAKASKVSAMTDAKTNKAVYDSKGKSAEVKNDAEYAVAREKCGALAGAAKDKCVAEAKLNYGK